MTYGDRATTIAIDMSLLHQGKLDICLVQTALDTAPIAGDQSRASSIPPLRHLLVGGDGHNRPALTEMLPGGHMVLMVAPEFAFGSADWDALDALVRGAGRPVILFTGFGATPGQALFDWSALPHEEGQTHRHLGWDDAAKGMSGVRLVNAGWCWIHQPGERTDCFVLLKTHAEQNAEAVALSTIQYGSTVTHLLFNDVDIFPLICADLIPLAAQHQDCAQAKVREIVQASAPDRPALVVGALLQKGYNANWVAAIRSLLTDVMANRRGLVALCNIAYDKPHHDEQQDQWRSLTGVYGAFDSLPKGQHQLPVARALTSDMLAGAVLRQTCPMVVSGEIYWGPYVPNGVKFLWHGDMACPIKAHGLDAPITPPATQHGCELVRFMRRHPARDDWSPRVRQGVAAIADHVSTHGQPRPERILSLLLTGVCAEAVDADLLHTEDTRMAAKLALNALATMSTFDGVSWNAMETDFGQLHLEETARSVLIWHDPSRSVGQMQRELGAWMNDTAPHPDLLVIGKSPLGELPDGPIRPERRDDITTAPPTHVAVGATGALALMRDDIGSPKLRRRAASVSLQRLAAIYGDYEQNNEDEKIQSFLAYLTDCLKDEAA